MSTEEDPCSARSASREPKTIISRNGPEKRSFKYILGSSLTINKFLTIIHLPCCEWGGCITYLLELWEWLHVQATCSTLCRAFCGVAPDIRLLTFIQIESNSADNLVFWPTEYIMSEAVAPEHACTQYFNRSTFDTLYRPIWDIHVICIYISMDAFLFIYDQYSSSKMSTFVQLAFI